MVDGCGGERGEGLVCELFTMTENMGAGESLK